MHIIRVYHWQGGLAHMFVGLDAEKKMRDFFGGEPNPEFFHVLR